MGTPEFAVPCLEALIQNHQVVAVVTQPDKAQGRGRKVLPSPVKVVAEAHGLPVLQPANINNKDSYQELKKIDADVLIVVAYGQILKKNILGLTVNGAINVHASLLPKLRGGAPIHRAIINGLSETGVSTMIIEPKLDSGPVLLQQQVPITAEDNVGSLHDKLAKAGAELLIETLQNIGIIVPVIQDHHSATFAPVIEKEDRLIHWSKSAMAIFNQVRGLNPWPIAYTFYQGKQVQIWDTWVINRERSSQAKVGSIVDITAEGPVVQCGEGTLLLKQLRPAGKRLMSGVAFCNGYHCSIKDIFGEENL